METELITVFDEAGNPLGVASRNEIHKQGFWHQTFHCWFASRKNGKDWIHLQIRSSAKKDFPNLLDITAAGHLLADETVEDGVREVEEELGISLEFNDLVQLGVIKDRIRLENFIDNELCQVFLYRSENHNLKYRFQKEEVSGMVLVDFGEFYEFCFGRLAYMQVEGYEVAVDGERMKAVKTVGIKDLVPHERGYLEQVAVLLKAQLKI